jgi:hypothetical protein
MRRKAAQADKMFSHLIAEMNNANRVVVKHDFNQKEKVPKWL